MTTKSPTRVIFGYLPNNHTIKVGTIQTNWDAIQLIFSGMHYWQPYICLVIHIFITKIWTLEKKKKRRWYVGEGDDFNYLDIAVKETENLN